jgi:hypothetical protein
MIVSTGHGPVAVSRRISAPAGDVFQILTDPTGHVAMDGSGMVRGAVSEYVVSGVGDVFVMKLGAGGRA